MFDVEETDAGLRVVDRAKNEVEIELEDWAPGGEELEIDRDVDVTVAGRASEIRLPGQVVTIESRGRDQLRWVQSDEEVVIPTGEHTIHSDTIFGVFVQLSGNFSVKSLPAQNQSIVSLSNVMPITLGFRSHTSLPTERIRITPTVGGLASALSCLSSAHKTDTPDRSYPSMRLHPPLLTIDEDAKKTSRIETSGNSSAVLRTPHTFESLFTLAPLVYYLGATVELEHRESPLLATSSIECRLPGTNALAEKVGKLLSRVFYLDCLVRNAGPYGFNIHEDDLLENLSLDIDRLYSLSISDRLEHYLAVPFEQIADGFPKWPLAVSIAPTVDNIRTIPHLLNRMALLFPPSSKPIDVRTMVSRSLGDYYRSADREHPVEGSDFSNYIQPKSQVGAVNGWIADGKPIDAFKCIPEAFSNQLNYLDDTDPFSVTVILNDEGMEYEFSKVVSTYKKRAEALTIEVDVSSQLRIDELARVFETRHDFVHYIGHCDSEGLRCVDGNLSTCSLSECNVQAFFLNACQSYDEGLELIRQGSVAGAVTIGDVLDDQARKVGETFARIIGRGFSIDQALRLSRARAIMNRQYAIVGDGTHVPSQGTSPYPQILTVSTEGDDGFTLKSENSSPSFHGGLCRIYTDSKPAILGNDNSHFVSADRLEEYLMCHSDPILFDDNLYWPDELLEELF